jgi:hypothetical protein
MSYLKQILLFCKRVFLTKRRNYRHVSRSGYVSDVLRNIINILDSHNVLANLQNKLLNILLLILIDADSLFQSVSCCGKQRPKFFHNNRLYASLILIFSKVNVRIFFWDSIDSSGPHSST